MRETVAGDAIMEGMCTAKKETKHNIAMHNSSNTQTVLLIEETTNNSVTRNHMQYAYSANRIIMAS